MDTGTPSCKIDPSISNGTPCRLLELPDEIRNRIYREVLVAPAPIHVTEDNYQQPSLMRTCSQIRSETLSLYYGENTFHLILVDFDSTPALSWAQHARHYYRSKTITAFWRGLAGGGSWTNLLAWLRRVHGAKMPGFELQSDAPRTVQRSAAGHISRLFQQVNILHKTPWDTVRQVLKVYRQAVEVSGGGQILGTDENDS